MGVYIGEVLSVYDDKDGERIQARLLPSDRYTQSKNIPYAFPLLPKMLHVKPKVGEAVLIVCEDDEKQGSQRYYIGPIISQPQFINRDDYAMGGTTLLKGGVKEPSIAPRNLEKSIGSLAKDDDIAIYGRKYGDIIITDDDIRIRCGVRRVEKDGIYFNKKDPSFIKLKYHSTPIKTKDNEEVKSTASIVANKILLMSENGDPAIDISDKDESISDDEIKRMIENCHKIPYGDELVKFLNMFLKMFKSHTHKYHNLPPCPDTQSFAFEREYGITSEKDISDKILSNNVLIN